MRKYYGNRKYANLHGLVFQEIFLLKLQGHNATPKWTSSIKPKPRNQHRKPYSSHKSRVNGVRSEYHSRPSASAQKTLVTSVLAMSHTAMRTSPTSLEDFSSLMASPDALSTMINAVCCKNCLLKIYTTSQRTFISKEKRTYLPASAVPTSNRCQLATSAKTIDQADDAFDSEATPPQHLISKEKSVHDCSRPLCSTATSSWKLKKLGVEVLSDIFRVAFLNISSLMKRSETWAVTEKIWH